MENSRHLDICKNPTRKWIAWHTEALLKVMTSRIGANIEAVPTDYGHRLPVNVLITARAQLTQGRYRLRSTAQNRHGVHIDTQAC